ICRQGFLLGSYVYTLEKLAVGFVSAFLRNFFKHLRQLVPKVPQRMKFAVLAAPVFVADFSFSQMMLLREPVHFRRFSVDELRAQFNRRLVQLMQRVNSASATRSRFEDQRLYSSINQ